MLSPYDPPVVKSVHRNDQTPSTEAIEASLFAVSAGVLVVSLFLYQLALWLLSN
ncbi:MAG: hypothetical protein MI861_01640 [Pirellulales bacterium]|nr:hypothetical protein [Pirellulales bacterium]